MTHSACDRHKKMITFPQADSEPRNDNKQSSNRKLRFAIIAMPISPDWRLLNVYMSLCLRDNCGVSHGTRYDHEAVGLTQQPRGERKDGLSVATDQPCFLPANQSGSHEQFKACKVSSRPSTSRIQRHTADQLKNRKLPEREDCRQEVRGEGAYAIDDLKKHPSIVRNLA